MTLEYYRSIQRPRKSYHVNLPKSIIDIMDWGEKGKMLQISLASDKGEKVVVIRSAQKQKEEKEPEALKINVVT